MLELPAGGTATRGCDRSASVGAGVGLGHTPSLPVIHFFVFDQKSAAALRRTLIER
jgi:hypothetical protein